MWDAILEALLDSLKALPILLIVYILIEFMEHKGEVKFEKIVASSKKYGPLWGAGLGAIPQCGFSAVMADLFSRKMITIGTLFSVFIATSDEAVATLVSDPEMFGANIKALLVLIACKLLLAIMIGYGLDLLFKNQKLKNNNLEHSTHFEHEHTHSHDHKNLENKNSEITEKIEQAEESCEICEEEEKNCDTCAHDKLHHHHEFEVETPQTKSKVFWHIVWQGVKHTLEIFAYILIANIVISVLLQLAGGEEALKAVVGANAWYLPILCAMIGLIPNCAGSVVLVELYTSGIISFSACLGGLCSAAGVGLLILYKNNKNAKDNLLITAMLFLIGAAVGMLFNLFMPIRI
ncbi:MAG: arsenic efflux protein [Clostridia bacterium]|nr:arsenic efflux protein [Clostridia bacterium]